MDRQTFHESMKKERVVRSLEIIGYILQQTAAALPETEAFSGLSEDLLRHNLNIADLASKVRSSNNRLLIDDMARGPVSLNELATMVADKVYEKEKELTMAKAKLGSGSRFKAVEASAKKSGARDPAAVAASVGRKSLGAKKFNQLAAAGRRKTQKKK